MVSKGDGVYGGIWTYVEIVAAICCASLPALKSLATTIKSGSTAGKRSWRSDYLSWSSNSRHRRLPPGSDGDQVGSARELVDDLESNQGTRVGTATNETVVLKDLEIPGSAVGDARTGESGGWYGGREGRSVSDVVVPPAGIQVDTSISVYNDAKL